MASRTILAAVVAIGLLGARTAHGQFAPDEPGPLTPVPDDLPPPPPVETAPEPTPDPVSEPAPSEPTPSEPTPEPTPAEPTPSEASSSTGAAERVSRGAILGVGLGLAGATGPSADIYGPGLGLSFVLGYSLRSTSVEIRLGAGYATMPKQDALRGSTTRGSFDSRSIVLRQIVSDGSVAVSVFGGFASASIPLLSIVSDDITGDTMVSTATVTGTGVAVGAALHYPLHRRIELAAELTGSLMYWELPGSPYVKLDPDADSSATSLPYTRSTDDVSGTPWTVTVGLRVLIY